MANITAWPFYLSAGIHCLESVVSVLLSLDEEKTSVMDWPRPAARHLPAHFSFLLLNKSGENKVEKLMAWAMDGEIIYQDAELAGTHHSARDAGSEIKMLADIGWNHPFHYSTGLHLQWSLHGPWYHRKNIQRASGKTSPSVLTSSAQRDLSSHQVGCTMGWEVVCWIPAHFTKTGTWWGCIQTLASLWIHTSLKVNYAKKCLSFGWEKGCKLSTVSY